MTGLLSRLVQLRFELQNARSHLTQICPERGSEVLTLTFSLFLGVQWSNVYQPPEQTGMTFGSVCWMILFDSGLYFLCGWYLNNLIPGKNSAW